MADEPLDDDDRTEDGSIADRAEQGEEQGEMFPLGVLEGDERTLGNLTRGKPITELTVSLGAAEIPLRGGLLDPGRLGRALITYEPANYVTVPERETQADGSRKIVGWKVRNVTRAVYAEPVEEDPVDFAEWAFRRALSADPQRGAELADRVSAITADYMRTGAPA
jgi:hypothetical protein